MRLTDITVRTLPIPAKGQKIHFDDTLQGFGCRVSQAGTRSFVLQHGAEPPRRYIPNNPLEGVKTTRRPSRKRKLSDGELGKIYRVALEGTDDFSHIVALLVLTGQRRGETGLLQRPWFDEAQRTITIPETVTKNKMEHTFPYGDGVARVLKKLAHRTGYLFPASREHVRGKPTKCFADWNKSKKEFDERCGVSNWVLHDLRKKFATTIASLKVPPHTVERLLNHKFGSISNRAGNLVSDVAEVYNLHHYLPEMREAVEKFEHYLGSLAQEPSQSLPCAA